MINHKQLRELVIRPALRDLLMDSEEAEELLIFTCATESLGGFYLKQLTGQALGIYQMEPETYNDIWENFVKGSNSILSRLSLNFDLHSMPSELRLVYDLRFATAITRLHYYRVKDKIPEASDLEGIWDYYKTHYNTTMGAANKGGAMSAYKMFTQS